ncbi:Glycine N-methyltransferase [Eumeta japonica]|uniref:Glycine N-methyltransferase n=1 Tax=Eumeta variegata TaxID=151549 RepID=A0A4C1SQA5_EUMVA|nr:Glycine N-methyltransferase [Eumeta japonica]
MYPERILWERILNRSQFSPTKDVEEPTHPVIINTTVLVVHGRPELVTLDYCVDIAEEGVSEKISFIGPQTSVVDIDFNLISSRVPEKKALDRLTDRHTDKEVILEFRFWNYPHKLARFTEMLDEVFERPAVHRIYGDFRPLKEVSTPAFYIHVLQKQN